MKNNRIIASLHVAFICGAIMLAGLFAHIGDKPVLAQGVSQSWGGTSTNSGNNYSITVPNFDAYRPSSRIQFLANAANTGPATIAVTWQGGTLSAQNIYKLASGGPIALQFGEIQPGFVDIAYDGAEFILLSNQSSALAGMVFDWSGPVPPAGFLLAGGQAILRTSYSVLFNATTIQQNGTLNSTTTVTGLASTANLNAGIPVCGPGVNSGTTVASVDSGTQIHISAAATLNGTEPLVFAPNGCGDGSTTFNVIDLRSLSTAGKDDMGGTPANRLTVAGSNCNGVQVGANCGAQNQMIAQSGLPNSTIPIPGGQGSHAHGVTNGVVGGTIETEITYGGGSGPINVASSVGGGAAATITISAATLPAMNTASMNGGVTQAPTTTVGPRGIVYKIVKF